MVAEKNEHGNTGKKVGNVAQLDYKHVSILLRVKG